MLVNIIIISFKLKNFIKIIKMSESVPEVVRNDVVNCEKWRENETKRKRDEPFTNVIASKEDIAKYKLPKE